MKKLLIFLMIAIPLMIIIVVNLTVNVVSGIVSVSVDSISLSQTEIQANIEDTLSLEATILPTNATNKEIIWESTNEEVAKVDLNGNVTFIGLGKGYITATTVDGNKKASCYFYVTDTNVHEVKLSCKDSQNGNYFVKLGGTLQFSSVIYPLEALNKNVTYVSEDETIATVDSNGLVYGLKEGKTKISVISDENTEIQDSIIIEVVKPVEYLILPTKNSVTSAETYQVSYSIYPSDASITSVEYKVSDEEIATINSVGLVSFKKAGTVTVTIKTVEGGHTETIDITYTNGFATDLILNSDTINASINEGGKYIQYSTIPSSVDYSAEFSSDNEEVAYVDDSGYVQFIGGGSTIVRVKILKSETEYIEKEISVYIKSPATAVILEDSFTISQRSIKLNPKSYPSNSTNNQFFYKSLDETKAVVSPEGEVTFVSDEACEVEIVVYANENNSEIRKTVKVIFTDGHPSELNLEKDVIELAYGQISQIKHSLLPADLTEKMVGYNIVSQKQNNGGNDVVEILADGTIVTHGGGEALVEVYCQKANGDKIVKECKIIVDRKVEDIEIETGLDFYNGEYVTCQQQVQFNFVSVTSDATNKKILWELKNSNAVKLDEKSISFNSLGVAEIVAKSEDGNYQEKFYIRYLKNNIISATLNEIPARLNVGESFEINVISTLPKDATINPYVKISNQMTLNSSGKVLKSQGLTITATAGGTATLAVVIANQQYTYSITTIQKAEEIKVDPANIKTTNARIPLQVQVLPEDTSNKDVSLIVNNEEVAEIADGNILVFKKNGVANISAIAKDESGLVYNFTIEKIEKGTGDVSITGEAISMLIGETNKINLSGVEIDFETCDFRIKQQRPEFDGEEVIQLEEDVVKALSIGEAEIECILTDKNGSESILGIKIIVCQLCEDISFNTNLDYLASGEYITAVDTVALTFDLIPSYTTNKNYKVSLLKFTAIAGESISPSINEGKLMFRVAGTAIIRVESEDKNLSKQFRIRYTEGEAVDAILNVNDKIILSAGESFDIQVEKWIPFNTQNKQLFINEISHTQGVNKVIEISGNKITAISGGRSLISVGFADITKEVEVIVQTAVTDVIIDDEIVSVNETVTLKPTIYPSNATNQTLNYQLEENSIASISGNSIAFTKPGSVFVRISTTDGSNISKRVKVTTTFGYVTRIEINTTSKEVKRNESFNLFVKTFYPNNSIYKDVYYDVISSKANEGGTGSVVSVTSSGIVTAIGGGEAVVRVYVLDYYGQQVFADCSIRVISYVEEFNVSFSQEMAIYQASYTTSKDTLEFISEVSKPLDATVKTISAKSLDISTAVIDGNFIKFKKTGIVQIVFTAEGSENGRLTKTISIRYTDQLLSAKLDLTEFTSSQLTLEAGEKYQLTLIEKIPYDIENVTFSLKNIDENRIDISKQVIDLQNGQIIALNGGVANADVYANSIKIGSFAFKVIRKCQSVEVASEGYTDNGQYIISAKVLPSDTEETQLKYEIIDGNIATVDDKGVVIFNSNSFGTVQVKVSCVANPSIYKLVEVCYSNKVQSIRFKESPSQMYIGAEVLTLEVIAEPFNVEEYQVAYKSSDPTIATVIRNKKNQGVVTSSQDKAGTVVITAYIEGREEVFAEKVIEVLPALSDLELELDNSKDILGIGGYRVWGDKFLTIDPVSQLPQYTNKYQMNIATLTPADSKINLKWTSSDEQIATVDQNGLVTFLSTGSVTITVQPEIQRNEADLQMDSYTFTVVDGLNVFTPTDWRTDVNIVLQNNIVWSAGQIGLKKNLYGNGFMMDFSACAGFGKISVRADGVLIDNVVLRGKAFQENAALSSFSKDDGSVLYIGDPSLGVKDVMVKNSIIQNCYMIVQVMNSEVTFTGCIIENSLSAGLLVDRNPDLLTPSKVTIRACIFGRSLFSSIMLNPEKQPKNTNYPNKIYIEGTDLMPEGVRIYNWIKLSEFAGDLIESYVKGASEIIASYLRGGRYKNYVYDDEYIMMGISTVEINAAGAYVGKSVGEIYGVGYPYTKAVISENIVDVVSLNMTMYTYNKDDTDITPYSTYTGNDYKYIKQPF